MSHIKYQFCYHTIMQTVVYVKLLFFYVVLDMAPLWPPCGSQAHSGAHWSSQWGHWEDMGLVFSVLTGYPIGY
jgi:hypothetical protein